jgi:hypothetical protein
MNLEELLSMRISMNGFCEMPALSHIEDNLYVGMSPHYWERPASGFKTIFDFYPWGEYALDSGQTRYSYAIHDSHELVEYLFLCNRAREIIKACEEGPTLVHCQMGVNRSNLFAAAALCLQGRSIKDSIALLREKRSPHVLMNKHFEQFLLESFK